MGQIVSAEQQVLRALEDAREALLKSDTAALERLWGDEFSSITPSGQVRTRAQLLEAFATGQIGYLSLGYDELSVRMYGDTAIMTGRARGEGIRNGVRAPATPHGTRFTQVFVKRGGEWKAVAHQAATIAE